MAKYPGTDVDVIDYNDSVLNGKPWAIKLNNALSQLGNAIVSAAAAIVGNSASISAGAVNLAWPKYAQMKVSLQGGDFDWSAAMIAALADSAAASGVRQITVPDVGVAYKFTSGVTVPANAQLIGIGLPVLDFAPVTSGTALTQMSGSIVRNLWVKGNGKAGTVRGLTYNGSHIKTYNTTIDAFGTGYYGVNENTYINTFDGGFIKNCGLCIDQRLAGVTTNSGEKIRFVDTTFADSDVWMMASGSTLDMYFVGCSLDYIVNYGTFDNGQYYFKGGHIETNRTKTPFPYLFKKINGARVKFTGIRFGMIGIHFIVDSSTEGTAGLVSYVQTSCNFTPTATYTDASVTSGSPSLTSNTAGFTAADVGRSIVGSTAIPTGTTITGYTNATTVTLSTNATATASNVVITIDRNGAGTSIVRESEHQNSVAGGSTTGTFDSPFISRTVLGSVDMGFHNDNAARAITTPTISFASTSTLATVTYASAPASNAVAVVRFG